MRRSQMGQRALCWESWWLRSHAYVYLWDAETDLTVWFISEMPAPHRRPYTPASCSLSKYFSSVTRGYAGCARTGSEYNGRSYLGPTSLIKPVRQTHKLAQLSPDTPFTRHRIPRKDLIILAISSLPTCEWPQLFYKGYSKQAQCYTVQRESRLLFFLMWAARVCAGCHKAVWLLEVLVSHMLLVFVCCRARILWVSQVSLSIQSVISSCGNSSLLSV